MNTINARGEKVTGIEGNMNLHCLELEKTIFNRAYTFEVCAKSVFNYSIYI